MDIEELPFTVKKNVVAGFIEDYAVIADIHLCFEDEINLNGYNIGSKTDEIVEEIISLATSNLILLGDVRSDYTEITPKEGGVIFSALARLSKAFAEVIITKGNHDGGLLKLTSRLPNVKLLKEFIYGDVGFLHGHALPSVDLAKRARTICFGHLHPAIVSKDANGVVYKKDCWALFDIDLPKEQYKGAILTKGVCFPKFNRYIGSTDMIRKSGLMRYARPSGKMSTDMLIV